jgi:hypothetical protein
MLTYADVCCGQVLDVAEEAREGARALSESVREKLDNSTLRAGSNLIDSMAGLASSTIAKTFT